MRGGGGMPSVANGYWRPKTNPGELRYPFFGGVSEEKGASEATAAKKVNRGKYISGKRPPAVPT